MSDPGPPLDPARLQRLLPGWNVICLGTAGSTNDEVRALAQTGAPAWTVVTAEEQTAGRGRRGAPWISPRGRNLLLSVLVRPPVTFPPDQWPRLTLAAALAGCDALDSLPGLNGKTRIKWPNDLYLSDRKLAGILVESGWMGQSGFVIVGSGFNLNLMPADFPEDLRQSATSAWIESGGLEVSRIGFLRDYLLPLRRRVSLAMSDYQSQLAAARHRSWLEGKQVTLQTGGQTVCGQVTGLGAGGELEIRTPDGSLILITSADFIRPC